MSIYQPVRDEMVRLLSQPRLDRYKNAMGGDLEPALKLYAWNLRISAALMECIHYFEVALRNIMDRQLSSWAANLASAPTSVSWYSNPHVPLSGESRNKVKGAISAATDKNTTPEVHGKVITELSLGFWWSLLADAYNETLWKPCLQQAFPRATVRRVKLHESVDKIRRLRNRIAHHEPLFDIDLTGKYHVLLDTAERLSPRLAWWIDATSRVATVLDQRPSLGCQLHQQVLSTAGP